MSLPLEFAKKEIESIIKTGKSKKVLNNCVGCMSCNHYCPNHCAPYALIIKRWNERYYKYGLPNRAKIILTLPYKMPYIHSFIISKLPKEELYGLTQQLRRSAVSIPSNIAEGYGRKNRKEYQQFLSIAYGSLQELETQYLLSIDLEYSDQSDRIDNLLEEVGKILHRMIYPKTNAKSGELVLTKR